MVILSQPADAAVHAAAARAAVECRRIIQVTLREEEWRDADREFYLVIREHMERLVRPPEAAPGSVEGPSRAPGR